ncbi:hypothetical protein Ciccas_003969 [Cichlidogyrus casuarinus]|uniref:Uncharacterized protein n=1 Tax=Cichlidogyrus casuarinus TaxID=1844966 RepID=A0ABD2QCY2_9PLAT
MRSTKHRNKDSTKKQLPCVSSTVSKVDSTEVASFSYGLALVSTLKELLFSLRDCSYVVHPLDDSSIGNDRRAISFTMLIAYVISRFFFSLIFLAVSILYLHSRMSQFSGQLIQWSKTRQSMPSTCSSNSQLTGVVEDAVRRLDELHKILKPQAP